MNIAVRAALRGFGKVEPNPMVGCVLVAPNGDVIGIGHHRRFGEMHAEPAALAAARAMGHDPRGATAYVTLEPCNAAGRNPPCSHALLAAGVGEVVFARRDTNPAKAGGAEYLRGAGVTVRLLEDAPGAAGLSAAFIKRTEQGLPWVVAKWAQTIDGRIATRTGESKWISSERSRRRVHQLRSRIGCILTGIGTVLADDPMLTPRGVSYVRSCTRVVVDTDLEVPLSCALVSTAGECKTLVACDALVASSDVYAQKREGLQRAGIVLLPIATDGSGHRLDLQVLLQTLYSQHGVASVMIEAGPGLLGSFIDADLIDEAWVYIAPMLLGDELAKAVAVGRLASSLAQARRFERARVKALGDDIEIVYRRIEGA